MTLKKTRQILLFLGDIFLLYLSLFLALAIGFLGNFNWGIFFEHLFPFSILYLFWLIIFYIFGFYDLNLLRTPLSFYIRITTSLLIILAMGMIFFYLFPIFGITPKTNLILNVLIFGFLFFIWRKIFYSLFSSYFLNKVAIVDKNPEAKNLAKEIENSPYLGYKFVDFLDPKENFFNKIQKEKIDTLILALDFEKNPRIVQNLYQCLPARIIFLDLARAYEIILEKIPITQLNQIWFLENLKEREKSLYEKTKRIIDIILSSLIILLTLPFWPLIALAITLEDKEHVFYKQERIGKDKKIFILYKFRSMIPDAEKEGPKWAEIKDERVTKIGNFLRKLHLDEIPQMLNVLKGDISLVGPRPERPEFVKNLEKEIPHYHLRHLLRPGFTGWAQIKFRYGRSITDAQEKFQYDLYYIKNRSLFLDLRILLKTFQLFFKKD